MSTSTEKALTIKSIQNQYRHQHWFDYDETACRPCGPFGRYGGRCRSFGFRCVRFFLVIIGANVSGKAADHEHPYGHDRMECVISIILANILLLVGAGIGLSGLEKIFPVITARWLCRAGWLLLAAVISIAVKEGLFWYTRIAAKKINSVSLMAEAWHHRSDALSSIGSFAGILGARLGYPVLDPLASVIIAIFILKSSIRYL